MSDEKKEVKRDEVKTEAKTAIDTSAQEYKDAVRAAAMEAVAALLPSIVAGIQTGQSSAILEARRQEEASRVANGEQCSECFQKKVACKGEHMKAIVFPAWAHPSITRWYRGQWVNGVNYKSRGPGHFITIPKNSDILTEMHKWAKAEEELQLGRARDFVDAGADGLLDARRHV